MYDARVVAILAWVYFAARVVYVFGYNSKYGEIGRTPGTIIALGVLVAIIFYGFK